MTAPLGRKRHYVVGMPGPEADSRIITNPGEFLLLALVADAVTDLVYGAQKHRANAIEWLLSPNDGKSTFRWICQWLGWDYHKALDDIQRNIARQKETPMARFTDDEYRQMHAQYCTGTENMMQIAERYQTNQTNLSQNWRRLGLPTRRPRPMTGGEKQRLLGRREMTDIISRADYPADKATVEALIQRAYGYADWRIHELEAQIADLRRELAKKNQELSRYKYGNITPATD